MLDRYNFRVIPPAGNFLPFFSVFKKYLKCSENKLNQEIKTHFPKHNVFTLNSGKAALLLVLKSIKEIDSRSFILISAYTCPDIAICAILAGFKIRLLDTHIKSSSISVPTDDDLRDCVAVISSNLYGEIDDSNVEKICKDNNLFHIDDACQSAHSFKNGSLVGRSENSIGIFSFGRGKAYSAVGGGMLTIPKNEYFISLAKIVEKNYHELAKPSFEDSHKYLIKLAVLNILKYPYFYGIVTKIRFFKLGETIINFNIEDKKASKAELALISFALSTENIYNSFSRKALIVSKEIKQKFFAGNSAKKLGLSPSYPKILIEYHELKELLHEENKNRHFPNAKLLSETILTIPNHDLINEHDRIEIYKLLTE